MHACTGVSLSHLSPFMSESNLILLYFQPRHSSFVALEVNIIKVEVSHFSTLIRYVGIRGTIKVKVALEQALKAQKGSTGIILLLL